MMTIRIGAPTRALFVAALTVSTSAAIATAQDSATARPPASAVGFLVGLPAYAGQTIGQLATVGVSWTQLHPQRLGADVSLGTAPRAIADGQSAIGARADAVFPLAIAPSVFLLPAAGVSMLAVTSDHAVLGVNAGVAVMIVKSRSVGFRAGVTVHRFQDDRNLASLVEAGVVWAP